MTRFVTWLLLLVISATVGATGEDVAGSQDSQLINRWRGSSIVDYRHSERVDYRLALGAIQKVNGVERPEQERRLSGQLTRISYRLPEGLSGQEVFTFFHRQLAEQGGEELFQCRGRRCGSSNYWANQIFAFRRLFGLEDSQFYLAMRLPGVTAVVYVVQRGNRQLYAHLDLLETNPADRIAAQLDRHGYAELASDQLPEPSLLNGLQPWLSDRQARLILVVHHQGQTLSAAHTSAEQLAQPLRQQIKQAGLEAYFQVQAIGALAPQVLGPYQSKVVAIMTREPA